MAMLAVVFPLLPGKADDFRAYACELSGARRAEFDASQHRVGATAEHWFHQPTPQGDLAVILIKATDPGAAIAAFGASQELFDLMHKERIRELSGVDMNQPPAGPLPEQVFTWSAP